MRERQCLEWGTRIYLAATMRNNLIACCEWGGEVCDVASDNDGMRFSRDAGFAGLVRVKASRSVAERNDT